MLRGGLAGLLGAAFLSLGPARPAAAACTLARYFTLPVTMVGSGPTVEVKLNGAPVRLVADSGAFYSTLSPAAASQLQLKTYPAPFGLRVSGINGDTEVEVTKVKTFGIAGAEVPNLEFLVGGGSLDGPMGVVGLLGQNVLGLADVDYDFAHGELSLVRPKGCGGENLGFWAHGAPAAVMTIERTEEHHRSAVGLVKVNGVDLRAEFDTGASTSALTLAGARKAKLDVNGPTARRAGVSTGVGRRLVRSWIVPVQSFQIGGEQIKTTKLRVSDMTIAPDMLIGADFFLSHHVYVANSQGKVYFTYNGGPVFDLSIKPGAPPPPEPAVLAAAPSAAPSAGPPAGLPAGPDGSAAAPGLAPAAALGADDEPKDADGYSRRGQAHVARRDYARGLADLSRAVELDGSNPRYLRERAQLRLLTRQPYLAMADLDAELKLAPDDAESHLIRARLRASGRDLAGEAADLDAADRAAPKQADLRLAMASMFTGLEQFDRAVAQYDQWLPAHEGDSRRASALNGRCWTRAQAGKDLDRALADCDAALRLQPRTASYLDSRGLVRLRQGDLDRALADYDAALAVQPKLAWALYGRGVVKARKGDAAGGQADMAAAAAANAQVPELARRRGVAP